MTYYDRDSDIAYFEISNARVDRSSEHEWGLLDPDAAGKVVGAEYWHAAHPAGTSRSPRNTAPRDPWVARSPR
jgi:uncharacterized protein YuzE